MRHATWSRLETSPFLHGLYRNYRRLPDGLRAPLRAVAAPHWHFATQLVRKASGDRVVAGPFRGMALNLSPLSARHLLGYILGSQELELRDPIERIIARGYATILNVGAADGYYAVGLAMRSRRSRVIAFEMLPELHPVIGRTAELNGVGARIAIRGGCEIEDMQGALAAAAWSPLVFMDIEGGEMHLLDPASVPQLCRADILVETHDAFVDGCTETLIKRFAGTHTIERYQARPRTLADFPPDFLRGLHRRFPRLAVDLMDERRTGLQQWLYMTAMSSAAGLPEPAGN